MKEFFKNLFSNDRNPADAEKSQMLNKIVIGGGLASIAFLAMMLIEDDSKSKRENIGDFKIVDENKMVKTKWIGEASVELQTAKKQLRELSRENKQLKEKLDFLTKSLVELKKEIGDTKKGGVNGQLPSPAPNENLYTNFPPPPTSSTKDNNASPKPSEFGLNDFGVIPKLEKEIIVKKEVIKNALGYENIAKPKEEKPKEEAPKPLKILSTGTITKAILLGGMDAPTMAQAKDSPLPVLLKVTDLSFLPNDYRYDLQSCFILGEGYGDLSSERAYIRTNTLSCITKDGYHIEAEFKGAVYGEDGKIGLRGRVVTKQGALLARSIIAGFLQGVSEAFGQSNTIVSVSPQGYTQTIDPNKAMQAGIYKGASKAAEKLADFYLKMADQVAPIIEISAGRFIDVVNTAPVKLLPLEEMKKQKGAKK